MTPGEGAWTISAVPVVYAVQTLRQLLPGPGRALANVAITDWPRFPIRGGAA